MADECTNSSFRIASVWLLALLKVKLVQSRSLPWTINASTAERKTSWGRSIPWMYVLSKPLELVSLDAHTTRRPNKCERQFSTLGNSVKPIVYFGNWIWCTRFYSNGCAENLVCDRDAAAESRKQAKIKEDVWSILLRPVTWISNVTWSFSLCTPSSARRELRKYHTARQVFLWAQTAGGRMRDFSWSASA